MFFTLPREGSDIRVPNDLLIAEAQPYNVICRFAVTVSCSKGVKELRGVLSPWGADTLASDRCDPCVIKKSLTHFRRCRSHFWTERHLPRPAFEHALEVNEGPTLLGARWRS
jgi:hypothetical protein